jgi:hypothetical protein
MVDCVTQWLLNPLHKALFKVLRGITEDGTFDQEAAVSLVQEKLRGRKSQYVASLDLSAATPFTLISSSTALEQMGS